MNNNFYIPEGIAEDFKYIVPSDEHYDVYNTNYLEPNQTYNYYRFYNNLDQDMYIMQQRQTTQYNYGYLNAIEIKPQHSYIYRKDYHDIVTTSAVLIIGIIALFNIVTSIIRKGGLFSGLL